ncbi:MAG: DUF4239 domain-containing protein [Myxococcaceae bacterium]
MSSFLQALLIVGGATAAAVLVQRFVRRKVALEVLQAHHEVAGVLMGLVGGMYGILIAFVIVALWSDFEEAREIVASEAIALADLSRLASTLPAPTGPRTQQRVLEYLEVLTGEEWDRMAEGSTSARANELVTAIWSGIVGFEPRTERERNLHLTSLQALDRFSDMRRLRILMSRRALPTLLWVVLISGGVIVLGFANFFGLRYPRSQSLMTGATAATVALALYTVVALGRPYQGAIRVPRGEVEEVLTLLESGR